jgi:hypothetical protein
MKDVQYILDRLPAGPPQTVRDMVVAQVAERMLREGHSRLRTNVDAFKLFKSGCDLYGETERDANSMQWRLYNASTAVGARARPWASLTCAPRLVQ